MVYNTLAVGDALREIREQNGYTQSDMAENLEISCIHYASIEQGRQKMRLGLMLKMVSLYGVGLDKLFEEPMKIFRRGIMGRRESDVIFFKAVSYMLSGKAAALVTVNVDAIITLADRMLIRQLGIGGCDA